GLTTAGTVCASDAFFPFRDGLDVVARAGATAVIQPGGSLRDEEVIAAADEQGLAMVFTGIRHFRHWSRASDEPAPSRAHLRHPGAHPDPDPDAQARGPAAPARAPPRRFRLHVPRPAGTSRGERAPGRGRVRATDPHGADGAAPPGPRAKRAAGRGPAGA